jgi:nitrite reductase/ring-hydroxylating ferredoxin subunit/Fe-S cluster biogenesis protein NfuA
MNDPQPPPGAEQAAREDLLDEVQQLITALEAHSDPAVGTQLKALLEGIDTVHRAALTHLVGAIESMAGQAFMNRLTADPAIRLLLMSYDLLAVDRRILAEEAIDLVRGHLHSHGIDVELVEVVGGVVYVRLHGLERSGHDADAVLRDLEAALREGLVGFQEVVLRERERAATFVRLGGVRRAHKPVYHRVAASAELGNGELLAVSLGAQQLILARVNGEAFALAGCCGDTPLPLRFSQLDGYTLECSWHGCQYDVRTGAYTGRRASRPGMPGDDSAPPGQRLAVFPVREENGDILVAVAVAPVDPKGT